MKNLSTLITGSVSGLIAGLLGGFIAIQMHHSSEPHQTDSVTVSGPTVPAQTPSPIPTSEQKFTPPEIKESEIKHFNEACQAEISKHCPGKTFLSGLALCMVKASEQFGEKCSKTMSFAHWFLHARRIDGFRKD